MKAIVSAMLALSVLAGSVAPAAAAEYFPYNRDEPFNGKKFFEFLQNRSG
jgi:hypothetical protein